MHVNMYQTVWGEVRVSDDEAWLLQIADKLEGDSRRGLDIEGSPTMGRIMAKAKAIRDACEKFARSKVEAG